MAFFSYSDTFTLANGVPIGSPYAVYNGGFEARNNKAQISTVEIELPGVIALLNGSSQNGSVDITCSPLNSGPSGLSGVVFRCNATSSQGYAALVSENSDVIVLYQIDDTDLVLLDVESIVLPNDTDIDISVSFSGSSISVSVNGAEEITYTDTLYTNNTYHGFMATSDEWGLDNFDWEASSNITLDFPLSGQMLQRETLTTASIPINITSSNTGQFVQARFNNGPWYLFDTAIPDNGQASYVLPNQSVGTGFLELQVSGVSSEDAQTSNPINIGDVFAWIGSNNSVGQFTNAQTYTGNLKSSYFINSWSELPSTGYIKSGSGYSLVPELGNRLESKLGVPVGFIDASVASSSLVDGSALWDTGNSAYTSLTGAINSAQTNGIAGYLIDLGQQDAIGGVLASTWRSTLNTMLSSLRSDSGYNSIAGIARTGTTPSATTQNIDNIRLAQTAAINDSNLNVAGPDASDRSGASWITNEEADNWAARWAISACDVIETFFGESISSPSTAVENNMAWSDNMLIPLRVLINDMDLIDHKYTDDTLRKLLVTAATYVQEEVNLSSSYTITYNLPNISPDPGSDSTFTSLVVMKAACLTNQWAVNSRAISQGVRARVGPIEMQTDNAGASIYLALLNDGFCGAYQEMKRQENFGNSRIMKAVLTPFSHSDYQPY